MENLKFTSEASNVVGFQKYFNTGVFYQNANLGQLIEKSEKVEFFLVHPNTHDNISITH